MRFGSLFAGIGGFDLGLERAGMRCAWQVERDAYATKILQKHWPNVPRWDDVRTFPPPEGDWEVDLICGGFPCQDISVAGKGAGLAGARSGLWYEFARIIGVLRPRYVVVENVAALLTRGMDSVLGSLSTLGYDAEWHVIPASAVGAPHRRERVWIVAHADSGRLHRIGTDARDGGTIQAEGTERKFCGSGCGGDVSDTESKRRRARRTRRVVGVVSGEEDAATVAYTIGQHDAMRGNGSPCSQGVAGRPCHVGGGQCDCGPGCEGRAGQGAGDVADAAGRRPQGNGTAWDEIPRQSPVAWIAADRSGNGVNRWWATEPDVGRVAHGVPARVDRLRCLGNAVVPQVVELIGRAIMAREQEGGR